MAQGDSIVYIIDDDEAVRQSLLWLLESVGQKVVTCADALEFLELPSFQRPACIVSDVRMPGISGLELQQQLQARGIDMPVIIITGHGDVTMAVRAMKAGAFEFVEKPFNDQFFVECVQRALAQDRETTSQKEQLMAIHSRIESLTQREHEVLDGVVDGLSSRQIGEQLGISSKTIEVHRSKMMVKMGANSVADLVRMVMSLSVK
jgi:RNA polymerase sigma factor (sigma-70 family)